MKIKCMKAQAGLWYVLTYENRLPFVNVTRTATGAEALVRIGELHDGWMARCKDAIQIAGMRTR